MQSTPNRRPSDRYVLCGADGVTYFGLRVFRLLTLSAMGAPTEGYFQDYLRRQVELASCLVNPGDGPFTYEIRLISRPHPARHGSGTIELWFLARADGLSPEATAAHADDVLRLVQASAREVDVGLAPLTETRSALNPFPVDHLTTVTRRCGWQSLDSLAGAVRRTRVGFASATPPLSIPISDSSVFYVCSFLAAFPGPAALFDRLLLHPTPIAVAVRLRPTRLLDAENEFLEQQIARCEKYAQLHLGTTPDDPGALQATLHNQARIHEQHYLRSLHELRDDAAVLTVDIASPMPLPPTLADAIAHSVSEPAAVLNPGGRGTADPVHYLSGGYELVPRDGEPGAAAAFASLDIALPEHPLLPPTAPRLLHLFDAGEAIAAFRFPQAEMSSPFGIDVRRSRYQPAPPVLPHEGVRVGVSGQRGAPTEVRIGADDRLRHVYVVGQTGTGKTTLLRTMILDDIERGNGVCLVDPHGDLFRDVLARIPDHRLDDVVVLDPADVEHPVGINLLEVTDDKERFFVIGEMTDIIWRLMRDDYGETGASFVGPIFFQHMRYNLALVMSDPAKPGSLVDFCRIFTEADYWKRWTPLRSSDPALQRWVKNVLPRQDYQARAGGDASLGSYVAGKFEDFVFDPMLRNIFGQRRSTIDLRQIMDDGKILLVNLAKGLLTASKSRFLGMIVLAKLLAAAMSRARMGEADRRPFYAYIDEFQAIATGTFIGMLSEGRKFGLGLVLANQFVSQLSDRHIVDSIFGNAGTLVAFRMGQADAELMERIMGPVFSRTDLTNLPNWQAAMTTLVDGQTVQPFSIETTLPGGTPDLSRAQRARALTQITYSRPRLTVERELNADADGPA